VDSQEGGEKIVTKFWHKICATFTKLKRRERLAEKLNTTPAENPQPSLFDTGPAEAPAPEPPAPEKKDAPEQEAPAGAPGDVEVSADQIEKLMAERRAAERAEVEKNEPPTPAPEERVTGEKPPWERPLEELEAEQKKPRRGRTPKEEKAGPGAPGGTGARRGRPPKDGKAAPDKPPSPPQDKMSQSKGTKRSKGRHGKGRGPPPLPRLCRNSRPRLVTQPAPKRKRVLEQMFSIVDSRYRSGKPLIMTANLKLAELKHPPDLAHTRIYDRILERCAPILFAGKNFREDNAASNRAAARQIITSSTASHRQTVTEKGEL